MPAVQPTLKQTPALLIDIASDAVNYALAARSGETAGHLKQVE